MASKISDLSSLTGETIASGDLFAVVDIDAGVTKKITFAELFESSSISTSVSLTDDATLVFGTGSDVVIDWDGTNLVMAAAADDSLWEIGDSAATQKSFDIKWYANEGSGASFLYFDASANLIYTTGVDLQFLDSDILVFGTGAGAAGDIQVRWDGTDLDWLAAADDLVIKWGNGTNSIDQWWYGNAATDNIIFDASANTLSFDGVDIILKDSDILAFGDASDVTMRWDGTDLDVLAAADDSVIKFGNGTESFDVWIYGNASGDTVVFDASANMLTLDGIDLTLKDADILIFGDSTDVSLRWDGTDLDLLCAANNSVFKLGDGTTSFDLWVYGSSNSNYLLFDASANSLTPVGAATIRPYVAIADPGDAGAIPVTVSGYCPIVTAGAETRTLAAPTYIGQTLLLYAKTAVGNAVVTAATTFNEAGNTILTFTAAGQAATMVAVEDGADIRWRCTTVDGCALSGP